MYQKIANFNSFAGLSRREVFGHRCIVIPKHYPDSQLILQRRGMSRELLSSGRFFQLNIYTTDTYGLPDELFTDPQINWHHQQFGQKGLVAAAGLWVKDATATITVMQSDLCQQLYRHPKLRQQCKSQVETHFRRWYVFLMNAILDLCLEQGLGFLYCPTGREVVGNTEKPIIPELFLKIYDHVEQRYACRKRVRGNAEYWEIPVQDNAARVARLVTDINVSTQRDDGRYFCIFHDIEENVDTAISAEKCARNLTRMLEIEKAAEVDATYDILGIMFSRKRDEIQSANPRHSIAFHSFNHNVDDTSQLEQCRRVDLRVRGYRPPKSVMTSELTDYNLSYFDFEWLASAADSLGTTGCRLKNGIVQIPVHFDDYPLHTGAMDFARWQEELFTAASSKSFFGLGLHDCYAGYWLENYPDLLETLAKNWYLVTADQMCQKLLLQHTGMPLLAKAAHGETLLGRFARWLLPEVSH